MSNKILINDILDLFGGIIVPKNKIVPNHTNTGLIGHGIVIMGTKTHSFIQNECLLERYPYLNMNTLFSVEEREKGDVFDLIVKQLLHYVEIYGLNSPGLFNLECDGGQIVKLTTIFAYTKDQIADKVRDLLYANSPIKDTAMVYRIIDALKISYDFNKIKNNELKVWLFDRKVHTFDNGDDAVRWICYKATGSAMLIKSREVIAAIKTQNEKVSPEFLQTHARILAEVFNRHKKLIIAMKNKKNRTEINLIARKSKKLHVPVREAINKTFVAKALNSEIDDASKVLDDNITLRDKFKFLNLLRNKMAKSKVDSFVIRNGKVYISQNRKVWSVTDVRRVEQEVLDSIKRDLSSLTDKKILLDDSVRYGLPTSRKQTVGHLPFGTRVVNKKNSILSSGIYWKNEWGATDLDLSAVSIDGQRVGWGQASGYNRSDIVFSGDVTYAPDGAMEFMTSKNKDYGLFVNIFSGTEGCQCEIVIGNKSKDKWIENPKIREKTSLDSRGMVLGFVNGSDYIVYQGRMNGGRISSSVQSELLKAKTNFWTINEMFDRIGIEYDIDRHNDVEYHHDMTYDGFTYDKLEALLLES